MLTEIRERSMARKARPKLQQVTHTTILTQIQHEYDVTRPRSQNHQKVFFFSLIVSINRIRFLKNPQLVSVGSFPLFAGNPKLYKLLPSYKFYQPYQLCKFCHLYQHDQLYKIYQFFQLLYKLKLVISSDLQALLFLLPHLLPSIPAKPAL